MRLIWYDGTLQEVKDNRFYQSFRDYILIPYDEDRKNNLDELEDEIYSYKSKINLQKKQIDQFVIDKDELEFLRLNLLYSHKCQTRKLFTAGLKVGTPEYKKCILNKGKIDDKVN